VRFTCRERVNHKWLNRKNLSALHGTLARSAPGLRLTCATAAPSMRRAHTRTQRQIDTVVTRSISKPCAIHVRPPPDHAKTIPGPTPDGSIGYCLLAIGYQVTKARPLPSVLISAIHVSPQKTSERPGVPPPSTGPPKDRTLMACKSQAIPGQSSCPGIVPFRRVGKREDAIPDQPDTLPDPVVHPGFGRSHRHGAGCSSRASALNRHVPNADTTGSRLKTCRFHVSRSVP
jgi:hypothetical protein